MGVLVDRFEEHEGALQWIVHAAVISSIFRACEGYRYSSYSCPACIWRRRLQNQGLGYVDILPPSLLKASV